MIVPLNVENVRLFYTNNKLTLRETARAMNTPYDKLRKFMKDENIEVRHANKPKPLPDRKEFKKLYYDQDYKWKDMIEYYGVSNDTLLKWVEEFQLRKRRKKR